jgi:hypothetical protein
MPYRQTFIKRRKVSYIKLNDTDAIISAAFNGWVCVICDRYFKRGFMSPQNFSNKLQLDEIPNDLLSLSSLETWLLAQCFIFMKIIVKPRGGQNDIVGAVVNVPVDTSHTCKHLPRAPSN